MKHITEQELRAMLRKATKEDGGISNWARENGLFKQRANIGQMIRGTRLINKRVAKALCKGIKLTRIWEINE